MRFACWITKATNTHSEYGTHYFPRQQWLGENAPVLRYTGCPTRYRTRHFFNNFTTNEGIATKFEADLPHCVRSVKEKKVLLFKFRCNVFIVRTIKELPRLATSGTPCITSLHVYRRIHKFIPMLLICMLPRVF